jgi:hypothetical protein
MSYQILIVLFTLLQATLAAKEERMALSPSSPEFWGYLAVVILLVALSGLLAGRIVKNKIKTLDDMILTYNHRLDTWFGILKFIEKKKKKTLILPSLHIHTCLLIINSYYIIDDIR